MLPTHPAGPDADGQTPDPQDDTPSERAADHARVEYFAASGFAGPEFDRFVHPLIARGHRVLTVWTANRKIFAECARKGLFLGDAPLDWSEDDRCDLVQDSVTKGFRRFHAKALCARKWTPDGGASLSTYFIGSCVFAFADEYRVWRDLKVLRRLELQQQAVELGVTPVPAYQRVGAAVVDRAVALDALRSLDPRLAKIIALETDGYSHEEIASMLADGTTARGVEGTLYRHRRARPERGGR